MEKIHFTSKDLFYRSNNVLSATLFKILNDVVKYILLNL
jgi:hypothetical protein